VDTSSNSDSGRNATRGGDQVTIQELFPQRDASVDDRLPPQDLHAEQSVLGGMLLSKDAIADCVEVLRPADFYRPQHEAIFDAVLSLYGRGEPADAITVADELGKRGDLGRVGGQAYLHQLISSVPTAANAGYYAQIVAERAVLRRLVEAGTKIVQLGYAQGGGDVEDIVNAAQAEVYAVVDKRGAEDYHRLGDILEMTVDEIEVASGKSGEMTGVPTGFTDLDSLTNGLHPGQMIVVAARPAIGKALALDTPLPTPTGWTTMGDVAVGEWVLGADGRPTRVVAATEVMRGRPCYEVEFSDGSVLVADAHHQWSVGRDGLSSEVLTTNQVREALAVGATVTIDRALVEDEVPSAATWKIVDVSPVTSVPVRCIEVDSADRLYLAGESMIPTHNSTLGLDIVRTAAIRHNLAAVLFSLEMSKTEITMRLLSAEAGIQLQHMRKGTMREDDWTRLASTMGRVSDAPLFIDDSPNMSLMEIRAKCRRLKQRDNLKLVVIDYLQLMSSGKKVESRQQEVSEFSRALKLLAKELEVPVVAISQLNRGPEQRTDKRPQMSDLRESGCLTAETRVLRADTGAEVSLADLLVTGETDVPVWSLDESLRYVRRHLTRVFSTGIRPVFRLTLASGKTVRATENHPFLTYAGWRALGELRTGDRLAVPRHVPAPEEFNPWEDEQVILLAHMLGDGSMLPRQPLRYASVDEENLAAVSAAALTFGVVAVRDDDYPVVRCTTLRMPAPFRVTHGRLNPIVQWLDDVGVYGLRRHETFVPEGIFHVSKRQIALFLRHIWATDGSVTINKNGRSGRVYYASPSRRLIDDLSRLLLRFGISTRVRTTRKEGYPPGYTLDISGADSQRRFLQEIGVHGRRGTSAERLSAVIRDTRANHNVDTVPVEVWDTVRSVMADRGITTRAFNKAVGVQANGSAFDRPALSRERLGRVAAVLDSAQLELYAVNDVLWDAVVSIEPDGIEEVFDATVAGGHNFVANGVAVHNSIEQDSDVVILLHREEAYERESPRAGEADLIVAKHRNGPTDTIVLAFQGHYSRFTNMAPNF
jgi:replicative DNA helicase